jgi:hypothetical protein
MSGGACAASRLDWQVGARVADLTAGLMSYGHWSDRVQIGCASSLFTSARPALTWAPFSEVEVMPLHRSSDGGFPVAASGRPD